MNFEDVTPEELNNIRNVAERESFYSDTEVTYMDVLKREYALSLVGLSKYITQKVKVDVPVVIDNLGKELIVDFSDGDVLKIRLVESLDITDDTKQISIDSPVGKMLRTMDVDDINEHNGTLFSIVKILQTPIQTQTMSQ